METLHLVDPAAREIVKNFPPFDPAEMGIDAFRQAVSSFYVPNPELAWEELYVPGPSGTPDIRLLVFRPASEIEAPASGFPAIFYIHGGGFVAGGPDMVSETCYALARETHSVVIATSYRLAPEVPFPGPLEDCYAGLSWVASNAESLGINAGKLAVLGQSAGGGLAAALGQLARDRSGPSVAAQFLIYPMLDARTGTPDEVVNNPTVGQYLWTRSANCFGWDAMRGDTPIQSDRIGYFSPAQAKSFRNLPRTFIAVGSVDLFLDEDVAYAMNLSHSGVPVEMHVYPGGVHGFEALPGQLADQFKGDLVKAIRAFAATED